MLDAQCRASVFRCQVDGGPLTVPLRVPEDGRLRITLPDAGAHVLTIVHTAIAHEPGRWNGAFYFGCSGIELGAGGEAVAGGERRGERNLLIYGDSITEGFGADDGVTDITHGYAYYIGEALRQIGFEYGIIGICGQGYGRGGTDGSPPVFTPYDPAGGTWDRYDNATSRLAAGRLHPAPDLILDNHGTNDSPQADIAQTLAAFYTALRAAAPTARIIKIMPFGGYNRAAIEAGVASYLALSQDRNAALVDLHIDGRLHSGSYTRADDTLHPASWGHANIASLLLARILTGTA